MTVTLDPPEQATVAPSLGVSTSYLDTVRELSHGTGHDPLHELLVPAWLAVQIATCRAKNDLVADELQRQGVHPGKVARLRRCGEPQGFKKCTNPGVPEHSRGVWIWLCDQRALCPICDQVKANQAAVKALFVLDQVGPLPPGHVVQHLTVTTRATGNLVADRRLLQEGLTRLWQGALLQGRRATKLRLGMVASIENGPHNLSVHAHCLWAGHEIKRGELRQAWKAITRGLGNEAHQVEVTRTGDPVDELVTEILKYPFKHGALTPQQVVTAWKSRGGSHQTRWFGFFHFKALQKVTGKSQDDLVEELKAFGLIQKPCKVCGWEGAPVRVRDTRALEQYLAHVGVLSGRSPP